MLVGLERQYGALSDLTVGNGLARSVGEAAFATAIVLKTVGKMQRLTFFVPSGAAMPLRGRNEQDKFPTGASSDKYPFRC